MAAPPAIDPRASSRSEVAPPADPAQIAAALTALGGKSNIAGLHLSSSRLCVAVRDPAAVNESALSKAVRAVARPAPDMVHLVIGPEAGSWFAGMTIS